ncbi:TOBE domain-containing protein [Pseudomonas sp. LRF_L74]|uniref:TOBE domain-containing protein n=1 Tax=Pseudomonas sp. LRF_L74 TaxID=3369422 RepID=UPI003F6469E7
MSTLTNLAHYITRRPQRIALLQQIAEQGAITRAAKAAGLSYKTAWDAIDEMNNLAGQPLVQRSIGGKGGGGARLTATGERLLQLYKRLEQLQSQLFEAAEQDGDMQLLGRLMLRTSARNQLSGTVHAIHEQGRNDLIEVDLGNGKRLRAQITHESTELLELRGGAPVIALFKAGTIELLAVDEQADGTFNELTGQVGQILEDRDGPCEIRIDLGHGQTLCALLPRDRLHRLGLAEGQPVRACFAPTQVLLGIPT